MNLNEHAVSVITRPLPRDKVKKRPGKGGMEFSYITPDFVIETLNEAFQFAWDTRIVYQHLHDNVAVVGLELSVPASPDGCVVKQQFGSCEVTRGLGVGEAFKGAASDALKKCATLLGLGLELYQADEAPGGPPAPPSFQPPKQAPSRPEGNSPPRAAAPRPPAAPPPPRPPASRETRVAPPAGPGAGSPMPPRPPAAPPAAPPKSNPFAASGGPAAIPKPVAPAPPTAAPARPRDNPFSNSAAASSGPNATQINAMTNLAQRKGVSPVELISSAGVVDELGHAIQTFEELSRDQAIQVIKAAQQ